jgi:hypothetical protein
MGQQQAEDSSKQFARIIGKAWDDPAFKRRLINDPKAVAEEYGIPVPPQLEVRILENTETLIHVVLPCKPSEELLSDENLEDVAGGVYRPVAKAGGGTC